MDRKQLFVSKTMQLVKALIMFFDSVSGILLSEISSDLVLLQI